MDNIIKLRTKDNKNYDFEYKYFKYSNLFNTLFENDNGLEKRIDLLNVDGKSLERINYILKIVIENRVGGILKSYLNNINNNELLILLESIHYLDIPILEDLICERISDILINNSKLELEKMFNIKLKIKII